MDAADRSYRVGPAARARVDPALWDVRWPVCAGDPLVVRFGCPLGSGAHRLLKLNV